MHDIMIQLYGEEKSEEHDHFQKYWYLSHDSAHMSLVSSLEPHLINIGRTAINLSSCLTYHSQCQRNIIAKAIWLNSYIFLQKVVTGTKNASSTRY